MTEAAPDLDRLLDEAIDLVIRLQNDPGNPVAVEMIRAWRARGPAHEQIWARIASAHGMAGKVLTDRRKAEQRAALGLSRRNLVIGGAIGLGAVGAGSLMMSDALLQPRADHRTAKGEIRQVALPDGSMATLGPDSALALAYGPGERRVTLLQGMAFFEVAPDAARPFRVQTGYLAATALGTAFDVSSDAGIVTVSVDHGLVEARVPDSALVSGERLGAGDWMAFDAASQSLDRGRREAGQVAMWRDRLIVAEQEPVSALIARIGRWLPGRIVVAGSLSGSQKVSGLFDLRDPARALDAVVHPTGGHVRRISSFLTVISAF
ncbi:FecR family protein [Bosea psychrotolerans]|uniref:FecR family protein n=1 Tax=Bosea psychrotolerans TaxID=1871628 RepID=A0A2S4M1W4_9HYPH|nr:FecR domain-containing protein [Bosea psychrotolerans]POR48615.1 FecR family protein [Bosea psychrotolerans]